MTNINNNEWYSLNKLSEMKAVPGCTSVDCLRDLVRLDKDGENQLQAIVRGAGAGKRYKIKGENIKNYIKSLQS